MVTIEKRNNISKIIKENNLNELKLFIEKNKIDLKKFNTIDFDFLIYSLKNKISIEVIKFIINQCQYETYNYYVQEGKQYTSKRPPIFYAIATNNFKIANFLLINNADINYKENALIYDLFKHQLLNKSNLKYILSSGIRIFDNFIIEFLISNIYSIEYNTIQRMNFLEIILKYYYFDNDFIIKLLYIFKNKNSLSTKHLQELLINEHKIVIKDEWYKDACYYENNNALKVLLKYDIRNKDELLKKIESYKKLDTYYDLEENFYDLDH
ncbi:hypothetical protein H8356DRAFT_1433943 [Neocallimastix lanati (nom. inval.)]|uniref:Ankyrin n=1 Tax=Neocallimastix californiae TaxID=1754190 RepID=A0A1Y2D4V3_9FUNG|nr:hypothetical protein H8356DRAFT_1433943 [Neocallimastix sp. JGI-2020a]ORY54328.1 hypothetical protein LY90DRAFT_670099 [Neocallimastix californiae]|eukprot:ORY54328.1 hypothetical protein LY90DRAFT_670099 [Neocallimastix californiae]